MKIIIVPIFLVVFFCVFSCYRTDKIQVVILKKGLQISGGAAINFPITSENIFNLSNNNQKVEYKYNHEILLNSSDVAIFEKFFKSKNKISKLITSDFLPELTWEPYYAEIIFESGKRVEMEMFGPFLIINSQMFEVSDRELFLEFLQKYMPNYGKKS